jgi:putative thiamine transport system permease protein
MAADAGPATGEPGQTAAAPILKWAPALTLALFLGPVAAGLIGTLLPAFGYLPALGGEGVSLQAWRDLAAYPGVGEAVLRSFATGMLAAAISFALVVAFLAAAWGTPWFDRARAVLAPLLAVPHAALAMGIAFLLAPSGWILRLLSPWATGFERPPDLALAPDPYGWSLVLALVLKETPFLFLMMLGALNQVEAEKSLRIARSLGYDRMTAWIKTVLPQVYPQIRLPIFAALAFSVSVVDVALILTVAPAPTLGVLILRWANDPDLTLQFQAAAGAVLQGGIAGLAIGVWIGFERLAKAAGRIWIRRAGRRTFPGARPAALTGLGLVGALGIGGLVGLAVWSVTFRWRFPDALPSQWTLDTWLDRFDLLAGPLGTTVLVAGVAAAVALALVLACLEAEQRTGRRPTNRALWLLYTPLIVPQIAFLFGAQVLLLAGGLDGGWLGLIWAHLLFVLPYVFLSLSDPYRALDSRYARAARCLGARPDRVFWRIKLPMLIRPVLIAFAVGFAVSIGEYLPTVFAGAGRLTTLTTEAVALASGGDRRLVGALVVLQTALPLALFALAAVLPVLARPSATARLRPGRAV